MMRFASLRRVDDVGEPQQRSMSGSARLEGADTTPASMNLFIEAEGTFGFRLACERPDRTRIRAVNSRTAIRQTAISSSGHLRRATPRFRGFWDPHQFADMI